MVPGCHVPSGATKNEKLVSRGDPRGVSLPETTIRAMKTLIGIYSPVPGSGKTTVARFLEDKCGFMRFPFADSVKFAGINLLVSLGMKEHEAHNLLFFDKEKQIPVLREGVTGRYLLQRLGTDFGRNLIDPDIWVKGWKHEIASTIPTCDNIVADDVRFPNEVQAIRDLGGKIWLVKRPDVKLQECEMHESEGNLDAIVFDAIIINDGTIERLHEIILNAVSVL